MASILEHGRVLDGEIYKHGRSFQEISKLVKKYRPGLTEDLEFWVYDTFELDNNYLAWGQRRTELATYTGLRPSIQVCLTFTAKDTDEVYARRAHYVETGYEGAIVREVHAGYEIGHRSNHLLKVKTFMDAEYKIVGHREGVGAYTGCVIWMCETPQGQRFNVVPKGTLADKAEWFKSAEAQYGKMLKVKFFELTDDGIPRFPVGLGIRIAEDMHADSAAKPQCVQRIKEELTNGKRH